MAAAARLISGIVLLLLLAGCTALPLSSPPSLASASQLFASGQAKRALAEVDSLLQTVQSPSARTAALHLRGEIRFQLQQYEQAQADFSTSIAINSNDHYAVHRRWASSLMMNGSNENRARVAGEIAAYIADPSADNRHLLAAYHGYNYLWDQKQSAVVLLRMLQQPADAELDTVLPGLVVNEMLMTRSHQQRLSFASVFVRRYSDHVNLPTVLGMVFDVAQAGEAQIKFAAELASLQPSNLHMRFYAARFQKGVRDGEATPPDQLAQLVAARHSPDAVACDNAPVKATCEFYRNRLFARIDVLHAEQLIKAHRYADALNVLNTAVITDSMNARAWLLQGEAHAALGYEERASSALLKALAIDPELRTAIVMLARILGKDSGDPVAIRKLLLSSYPAPLFSDITSAAGLGNVKARRVAWGDFNGDGFDELLVDGRHLFLNQGGNRFVEISNTAGLPDNETSSGGLLVDYDNDGALDVLVTGPTSTLYRNDKGRLTPAFHFNRGANATRRTEAASFGDFNGDGFVDLYLANYEKAGVQRSICDQDQLFLNISGKRFEDRSKALGIETDVGLCGRGASWSDLNNDGRPEILVANYRLNRNRLLLNEETGLSDIAEASGMQSSLPGHTIAAVTADFNGDARPDIYITNLAHPRGLHYSERSRLLINRGPGKQPLFLQQQDMGLGFSETNADIAAADVDNDGDIDLFVTAVYPHRYSALYLNNGSGRFENVSWLANVQVADSWGTAFSDIDNDGDMDLVVAGGDGIRLLRNDSGNQNSLTLRIDNDSCQRQGVGGRAWLTFSGKTVFRELQAGKGTGTQDAATIHVGLGKHQGPVSLRFIDSCNRSHEQTFSGGLHYLKLPIVN